MKDYKVMMDPNTIKVKDKSPAKAKNSPSLPQAALVLSSGGARGFAHIGVIKALQEEGIRVASVAGSSMGAVVGGFLANDKLKVFEDWAINLGKMDVFKLVDFTLSTKGFIRGERIFRTLNELMEDVEIENLPIPYTAVAVDIRRSREHIFRAGSLYRAMRASMAIPTVITPARWGDLELVDGGIMNPIPVNHVIRQAGDQLIVVNVNAQKPYDPPKSHSREPSKQEIAYFKKVEDLFLKWMRQEAKTPAKEKEIGFIELVNRSIDLMQEVIGRQAMEVYQPELTINISKHVSGTFEFYKAESIIEEGYRQCKLALKKQRAGLAEKKLLKKSESK